MTVITTDGSEIAIVQSRVRVFNIEKRRNPRAPKLNIADVMA